MAKHPVPKYKTTKSKSRTRHSAFMFHTRRKLFGIVQKMRNLALKGNLEIAAKADKPVKKIKA